MSHRARSLRRVSAVLLIATLLASQVAAGGAAAAEKVLVFSAASTATALEDLSALYRQRTGIAVTAVHAASSTLAKQIANGAPAQIFVSANVAWMDYLADRIPTVAATRRDLLANRLVLIAPRRDRARSGSADGRGRLDGAGLVALIGDRRLAMGDPDHVPAGIYGRQALAKLGLWESLRGRVARMSDARAVLALVERGEAAAGIVYASDAGISRRVAVVAHFAADLHAPILYPAALVDAEASSAARDFFDFLFSPDATAVFARNGFLKPR